jgi:CSLREA domain-containing protein
MFFINRNRSASGGPIDPPPADGKRRKWATLAWVALFSLPLAGFQMRLALSGTLSAEVGGGGDAPLTCPPACGIAYTVDSTGDGHNVGPVTQCNDGTNHCTLRAAIEAANSHAGDDGIFFNIPTAGNNCDASGNCTINLGTVLPNLSDAVTITGPGASKLTVQRMSSSPFRIFNVTTTGVVTLSGMTISNGRLTSPGGVSTNGAGVSNASMGTLNIMDCALIGNVADQGPPGSDGLGGAVYNSGTTNITSSTLSGNSAASGGAIFNNFGTVTVLNSTMSNNNQSGTGSNAIYNIDTMSLSNCTVSNNAAGGVLNSKMFYARANVTVKSSIIALSPLASGADVTGPFTSDGFNLIGDRDGSTGFPASTDQTGTGVAPINPNLDPAGLRNNGGPTQTVALQLGSPAIDKGDSSNAARDQRNYVRSGAPDVGAFEFGGTIPVDLANISTRLLVGTGDNVLFGGFIVSGTQSKRVIVLATGPSLNLAGKLADPTLELYQGGTLLESNDNWVDSVNKQPIIDSGFAPANNLESAIIRTLPANNSQYTVIVRGVSNGTGIGVVQIFDLDRTVDSKLANISTRGLVQTGDNVVIGGFIVLGADPQKVIVIALGPSLPVPGKLADPTLELRDGNGGLIDSNDNWVDSPNKQAIIDSTVPPTNDVESAVVATLPSNGAHYTAIVRGVNNTTGVAVVEVFALQ